eukprot:5001624-Prymnesium_polylepis.1
MGSCSSPLSPWSLAMPARAADDAPARGWMSRPMRPEVTSEHHARTHARHARAPWAVVPLAWLVFAKSHVTTAHPFPARPL